MNEQIKVVLLMLLFIPLVFGSLLILSYLSSRLCGPLLFSYKLTPRKLEVRLFHLIPWHQVDVSKIVEIREVKWNIVFFLTCYLATNPFAKSYVAIKAKQGWIFPYTMTIAVTPEDPVAFVAQVRSLTTQKK